MASSIPSAESAVNYYEVLQISRNADSDTVQRVYRILAARYHPDNVETGNLERFLAIKEAFEVLSHPDRRKKFDSHVEARTAQPLPIFLTREFSEGVNAESKIRLGILCLLYAKRRSNLDHPGLSLLDLEKLMAFPREHLLFAMWYLRSRKYVLQDDRSSMVITAEGVEYLESHLARDQTMVSVFRSADASAVFACKPAIPEGQGDQYGMVLARQ